MMNVCFVTSNCIHRSIILIFKEKNMLVDFFPPRKIFFPHDFRFFIFASSHFRDEFLVLLFPCGAVAKVPQRPRELQQWEPQLLSGSFKLERSVWRGWTNLAHLSSRLRDWDKANNSLTSKTSVIQKHWQQSTSSQTWVWKDSHSEDSPLLPWVSVPVKNTTYMYMYLFQYVICFDKEALIRTATPPLFMNNLININNSSLELQIVCTSWDNLEKKCSTVLVFFCSEHNVHFYLHA